MKQQTEFDRGENKGYRDALVMSEKCADFPNKSNSYILGYEKGFKKGVKENKHAEKKLAEKNFLLVI